MSLIFYFFIFLLGLTVGSFLNCIIYRLQAGEGFLKGRSYCPYCKHILTWQELIPIFSFLILNGKCRYCHQKISWQYPLVEIATGLLFLLIFNFPPPQNFGAGFNLIIGCFLIIVFVYDLKHYIIPDKVIYPAIAITFFYRLFGTLEFRIWDLFRPPPNFWWGVEFRIFQPFLLSAILALSFFLLIILISRGKWMGWGDVKLAFFMGLLLGLPNILVALFLAFFIGAIIGMGLVVFGKKTLKSEIPFGPFLVTGTFIALFWGEKIVNWYLHLI